MRILSDKVLGITKEDYEKFDKPCTSDRRCLIQGSHSSLDHLRLGLAEKLLKEGKI